MTSPTPQPEPPPRVPRRCRWLGHSWVSTITGEPIDWVIGGDGSYLACGRCETPYQLPLLSPQMATLLRDLEGSVA